MNKFNLLKYLSKWKYLIFAVCVLGALIVYKYAMYNQEYTASTLSVIPDRMPQTEKLRAVTI